MPAAIEKLTLFAYFDRLMDLIYEAQNMDIVYGYFVGKTPYRAKDENYNEHNFNARVVTMTAGKHNAFAVSQFDCTIIIRIIELYQ